MLRPATIFVVLLAGAALAGPAWGETRCGWLQNPTPGNYWLRDSETEWIASAQGGYEAKGMDNIPDLSVRDYVRTELMNHTDAEQAEVLGRLEALFTGD